MATLIGTKNPFRKDAIISRTEQKSGQEHGSGKSLTLILA